MTPSTPHKWYKGSQEQYGTYVYRDDTCDCGCVRRIELNDEDKEVLGCYTRKDGVETSVEPPCTRKIYKKMNKKVDPKYMRKDVMVLKTTEERYKKAAKAKKSTVKKLMEQAIETFKTD